MEETQILCLIKKFEFILNLEKKERLAVILYDNLDFWNDKLTNYDPEKIKPLLVLIHKTCDRIMMENSHSDIYDSRENYDVSSESENYCATCDERENNYKSSELENIN